MNEATKTNPLIRILLVAGLLLCALAAGVTILAPDVAQAQETTPETPAVPDPEIRGIPRIGRGHPGDFRFGGAIDYDALLANELGITVDELQSAYQAADNAALEEAVAQGYLTTEQADLIKAREALKNYIDQEELAAQALGISVEELQAARENGQSVRDLIDELGLDPAEVQTAMQSAYQEAVANAVSDGVITQEQADQIQNYGLGFKEFGGGHRGPGGRGGHFGGPDTSTSPNNDSSTTEDSI